MSSRRRFLRLRRSVLLAPLAAAALAGSAQAAETVYDVNAFTFVDGTASGTDSDGWTSGSKFGAEMQQMAHDIPANPDGTMPEVSAPALISLTRLKQDYALVTVAGVIAWNCAQDGEAAGAPGSVKLTKFGETMTAEVIVAQNMTASRACTGFSSFSGDIDITEAPLKATFSFPASELADGSYSKTIDETLPCGEWTIFQVDCNLRFGGSISITRRVAATEEEPKPEVTPNPDDRDPDISSPPRPATPIKPKGKLLPKGKGAKVTVTCRAACKGKISATAIANKGAKAKPIGSKSFSSKGGTQKVQIMFGKGGSRTARQRGAVIINVKSSGSSQSIRLKTR